ncbi:hypothetical protein Tco_0754965 [Tanacetum coccineum]
MSSITAQQTKLDLELIPKEKRLEIGNYNGRLNPGKKQREPTFQVVLDALALTPCYFAFLTTANVPKVYMHQFWDSIYKYDTSYRFRMDKKKKFDLNLEIFRDIFQIYLRVHGQNFDEPPIDDVIVSFFKELGHTREIKSLSGKTTSLDKLCLSRAQILWGMYYKKNVDYVELLWEDFIYQIDNKGHKKQEKMYYPRFTKVIIHYFLTKDKTVSRRNKIGMHTSRDDYLINTLRFVSVNKESQIYGARLPESMTNPEMRETKAYKTYLGYATGVTPPKKALKFKKPASPKLTNMYGYCKNPLRIGGHCLMKKEKVELYVLLKTCCRRIEKDVKETLRSDQDLSECLNTSSMKFKESTPKKHKVKQVQQSCLGEDCWELYIPDLVPLVIYLVPLVIVSTDSTKC